MFPAAVFRWRKAGVVLARREAIPAHVVAVLARVVLFVIRWGRWRLFRRRRGLGLLFGLLFGRGRRWIGRRVLGLGLRRPRPGLELVRRSRSRAEQHKQKDEAPHDASTTRRSVGGLSKVT